MSRRPMYLKMAAAGIICTLGGPALMYYVTPAEGELFRRFSPELQAYNLANRARREAEYEDFMGKLREYSKSDKPIWEAAREAQERILEEERRRRMAGDWGLGQEKEELERVERERRRGEIRREAVGR